MRVPHSSFLKDNSRKICILQKKAVLLQKFDRWQCNILYKGDGNKYHKYQHRLGFD